MPNDNSEKTQWVENVYVLEETTPTEVELSDDYLEAVAGGNRNVKNDGEFVQPNNVEK
jgi:hypothetical protein